MADSSFETIGWSQRLKLVQRASVFQYSSCWLFTLYLFDNIYIAGVCINKKINEC